MLNYEFVIQDLCDICQRAFGVAFQKTKTDLNTPLCTIISNPNAIDSLYFFLEISRKLHIRLTDDMMLNFAKWSLAEYTGCILKHVNSGDLRASDC